MSPNEPNVGDFGGKAEVVEKLSRQIKWHVWGRSIRSLFNLAKASAKLEQITHSKCSRNSRFGGSRL